MVTLEDNNATSDVAKVSGCVTGEFFGRILFEDCVDTMNAI
tara:strand:+ start:379 stop:501 length:123 start_codon:yes stop_codon:yes gene_type:complete